MTKKILKPKKLKDFYKQMWDQKLAYETSPVTMARIKTIWEKSISPFWKNIDPKEINQQLVIDFINWHKEHRKGVQLVNVFKYLNNIFNVMVEAGAIELSKKPKLELPKDEIKHHAKQKGRYIKDDEFNRIIEKTDGWFRLYLLISYCTGMRKMEIGKMEVSRLRDDGDRYTCLLGTENTKTGRAREIPMPAMLKPLVDAQMAIGSSYLFPMPTNLGRHVNPQGIDSKWVKAKRDAKIDGKMRLHDIRHSNASNLAKDGISPIIAVTNLGMSLAMFQKTYLKLNSSDLVVASENAVGRLMWTTKGEKK